MLALNLKKRLLLFVLIFILSFFIVGVLSALVTMVFGLTTPTVRIITVLQDLIMFIMPAVATAMMVTKLPATLLCIDVKPSVRLTIIALITMLVSVSGMDFVIQLNQALPLPEDIAGKMADMEADAEATIWLLNGPHTVPNLIVSILIVGVLAGLSEELLFRGGLQRLLTTGGVNAHAAIWITAVVFSAMHMQFYGFVPRLLLGAFFGYALLWTRSLWVPIILHITNNTMFLVSQWFNGDEIQEPSLSETLSNGSDVALIVLSVVLTAMCLVYLKRQSKAALPDKPCS